MAAHTWRRPPSSESCQAPQTWIENSRHYLVTAAATTECSQGLALGSASKSLDIQNSLWAYFNYISNAIKIDGIRFFMYRVMGHPEKCSP